MVLLTDVFLLVISLAVLIETSHIVISSAVKISRITRLGQFVIGFIFVAFATSIPELAVSFSAITMEKIGISIGNILGSNIADICLVVGIAAIMAPMIMRRGKIKELSTMLFVTSIIPVILLTLTFASQLVGFILIGFFIFFIGITIRKKLKLSKKIAKRVEKKELLPMLFLFFAGIFGVLMSSNQTVISAVSIAETLGIAESVIAASAIAIGTSLPELVVGIDAMRKGYWHLVMGEAIGSTVTNISLVLGAVLIVTPFVVNMSIFTTLMMFVLLTNLFLWYFVTGGKLGRKEGLILLFIYEIFLIVLFTTQLVII